MPIFLIRLPKDDWKYMPNYSPVVGLDIGSSFIRAVQVTYKGSVPVIDKVAALPLDPSIIIDGNIDNPTALTNAIKELWKVGKFSTEYVRLGIGGEKVIHRLAELDWSNDKAFGKILPFLIKDSLVVPVENYIFDFHTLAEFTRKETNPEDKEEVIIKPKKHVLVVGAEKSHIQSQVDVVLAAGLKPISIDSQNLALVRSFDKPHAGGELADVSIDVGGDNLNVNVHKLGQPLFIRTVADRGGRGITQAIQKHFDIPWSKAEARKIQAMSTDPTSRPESLQVGKNIFDDEVIDLGNEDAEASSWEQQERIRVSQEVIREKMSEVFASIRETLIAFGSGNYPDIDGWGSISVSGGLAATPNFVERLSDELKSDATRSAPITSREHRNISEAILATQHEYSVAVGLAIGKGSSHD